MTDQKYLFDLVLENTGRRVLSKIEVPEYITQNLRFPLWDWQKEALQYFLAFDDPEFEYEKPLNDPSHLLFNMATGTGKTLLMACLMLYYYQKGHRNFLFFVNQNNIVDKTENNFCDPNHNKYLFAENIVLDGKTVKIKKVETFSDNSDDIQIKFTSIHKLHNDIYTVRENAVYLEDLQNKDIVMLADEAHHLNADTKKKKNEAEELGLEFMEELKEGASQKDIEKSWENTVMNKILKKGRTIQEKKNNNVLLEFTATVPKDESVQEKYREKTIFKFDLEAFLKAGYTKEINLISSSFDKKRRIVQALLFHWYRHKIALKNSIPNFKPVILFRSKTIAESEADYQEFLDIIENLTSKDFDFLLSIEEKITEGKEIYQKGQSRIQGIVSFLEKNDISFQEVIEFLQYNFSEKHCIITNSKDKGAKGPRGADKTTPEQDKLLNSLEDKNNHIRAIFTVQRLTEGWDVLNLYDIVRLYTGRDEGKEASGKRKAGSSTTSEVQLIGRGVRYFPFAYNDHDKRKRKFDGDLEHEMRILEELYFHSDNDERYIDELKRALKEQKLIQDNKKIKTFSLKSFFQESDFYKEIKIFVNEKLENPKRKKKTLEEIQADWEFSHAIKKERTKEEQVGIGDKDKKDKTLYKSEMQEGKTEKKYLSDFERHLVLKALHAHGRKAGSLLSFERLKEELDIQSKEEILKKELFGGLSLNVILPKGEAWENVSGGQKISILLAFFGQVENEMKAFSRPHIGSEFFPEKLSTFFEEPKEKSILEEDENKRLEEELLQKNWYVLNGFHGTGEEINLINSLKNHMGNLEEKYEEVYLLRNEEVYKIFSFEDGKGFQPDFLLFLKTKEKKLSYQIFIEPKGGQFSDNEGGFQNSKEGWKEQFLQKISEKYGKENILKEEGKDYLLFGLPLYNEKQKGGFEKEFSSLYEKE
ncbi:DEAD/DEAH box helicase family protein [Candidatus Peregrinibacteria bacterium]|nr:MAG: DEAD/DEAH box helicase family protein [Candidatus Peregrinibacteria bacterium]